MNKKILKVGFDLDGVILYNPVRIFRSLASSFSFIKPLLFHERSDSFYFPNGKIEQFIWRILHKTSFHIADGIEDLKELTNKGLVEPYIITARYSFLKKDFDYWINKLNNRPNFKYYHYNKNNVQPNLFKVKMIKQLKLDIFVEDNWGVIKKLNGAISKTKILWVSNIFDWHINYPYKFRNLKDAISYIKKLT